MSCLFCTDKHPAEIWRGKHFYLIDACEPLFPCYLRIVAKRHVKEMSGLTPEERTELWEILELLEEQIIAVVHPDKVNYAQFGNMVPHLHWHLTGRWADDTHFPECPWGKQQRALNNEQFNARRALTAKLIAQLPALLDQEFKR